MNADYRLRTTTLLAVGALLAISLTGCGGSGGAFKRGERATATKNFETAMTEFKAALDKDPSNIEYQLKYEQARYNAAFQHFEAGRRALDQEDYPTAKAEFTRVLEIDPTHVLANQELKAVDALLEAKARGAVEPEVQFDQMRQATRTDPSIRSQLEPKINGPISVHMNQDSRVAYESLAQLAG